MENPRSRHGYSSSGIFRFRQFIVFVVTFMGYASFSDAKHDMQENNKWNPPFDKDFEGLMNGIFLFTYAIGMLLFGSQIGDRFDAATVQSIALQLMALIYFILGASIPLFNIDSKVFFCALWVLNGLVQSVGWPTGIKLMANWFDGSHDGMIFGIWTACQCTGNIIGAAYGDYVENNNLSIEWNYWLPAAQASIMGIIMFFSVPTYPKGMKPTSKQLRQQQVNDGVAYVEEDDDISIIKNNGNEGVGLWEALKLPNIIMYGIIFACIKGANYTLFFWLPDFLETGSGHFSDSQGDQLSMYYNVGQIFGSWVCGFISDRFSKRSPTLFIFLLLSVTPMFMLRIPSDSFKFFVILCSITGFTMGGPSNLISSVMAAEVGKMNAAKGNPASLSTLSGIVDGMGGIGAAFCVYAATWFPKDSQVFIMLSILIVLSAILFIPTTYRDIKYMLQNRKLQNRNASHIVDHSKTRSLMPATAE